jgi:hypothetical protein
MTKLLYLLLFLGLFNFILAEDWEEILKNNNNIESVEKISVRGDKITLNGVTIKKVKISRIYTDVNRKMSDVIVLKEDLENAFMRKNKDIKSIKITLNKDHLVVKGKAKIFGGIWKVYLEGMFHINEEQEVSYSIRKATVKKMIPIPVPISFIKMFDKKINPFFKFKNLNIPIFATKIILEEDKIIIR